MPPVATTGTGRSVGTDEEQPGIAAFVLALCFFMSCTIVTLVSGGADEGDYQRRWVFFASDLGLVAVFVTQLGAMRSLRADWRRHPCASAALALGLSLLPALAAHPSGRGVAAILRWLCVVALARGIVKLSNTGRILVLGSFAGATAFQVAVALAERAVDGPVGLGSLGEPGALLIGGRYASSGVTVHPYVLAAWCTLGAATLLAAVIRTERPPPALVVSPLLPLVGVGLTMSRAGAVAVLFVLGSFAAASFRSQRLRVVLLAAIAATALGVGVNFSGWANRAGGTVRAKTASDVTSNRTQLLRQANGLIDQDPILGVGPGRYVDALEERPDLVRRATQRPSRPVHLVPYLVLVEGGLVALPALVLLGWAVLRQTWRAGATGVMITLSAVPFLALDHMHWSYPQGLMLTGIWLGALDYVGRRPS